MADFDLLFVCEDCKYFAAEEGNAPFIILSTCISAAQFEALGHGDRLYFCKMFESDR